MECVKLISIYWSEEDYKANLFTLKAIIRSLVAFSEFNLTSGDDLGFLNEQLQRIEELEKYINEMFSSNSGERKDLRNVNTAEKKDQQGTSITENNENPNIQKVQPKRVQDPIPEHKKTGCCKCLFGFFISLCLACVVVVVCLGGNLHYDMNPRDIITTQFWKSSCENTGSVIKSRICEVRYHRILFSFLDS